MKRIAIIDGNSLINRAYYAMRNPMITKEGIFTHGVFGFINMLDKIKRDYEPEYMTIAFDLKAPTFRHKEYEDYKAGRKKMPPELAMQIPLLKDVLTAMRICMLELEGFEADDLIGTVAKKAETSGLEPIIITGDKDELQLASDITKVIITRKGVSEFELYDKSAMIDKYGFTPLQFIDFKGLMGDKSDNIPGIPGVGEKTATKLIVEYGSLENIIENKDGIKPAGLKTKIEENWQLAVMSKRLATINTNVPIELDFDDMLISEPDYDALISIYTKLEFNKFLSKINIKSNNNAPVPSDDVTAYANGSLINRHIIEGEKDLSSINLNGETVIKVFGDNNHLAEPLVEGIAVLNQNNYYYFDLRKINDFYKWLSSQKISYIGHGLKSDFYMLMSFGVQNFETAFDTAIAQYVLDSGRSDYSISILIREIFHKELEDEKAFFKANNQVDLFDDSRKKYADYGFDYCMAVINLKAKQETLIENNNLENVFYNVELPLIEVMASMEVNGISVDKNALGEFGESLSEKIEKLTENIYGMAGESFNINSPIQLGNILFEKLGLSAGKKTKRGYSTSAEVLEKIKKEHPIVDAVLEYRTLSKLKSTYIDGLIPLINPRDCKVHAHFNQTVTTTGRISCTEPNLQNIPIRQKLGRQLRKAFVTENDKCYFIGADYSQIELRVLAHMAQDSVLIDAFNNGEDIHRATAANVLQIPEDSITVEERSKAKAVNFGVIYGMSSFGLSTELNITRKEAELYIQEYFKTHTAVKLFMDKQVEMCKTNGFVTTMMGRKRYIKEINASAYMVRQVGERLAMNTPIQGTAADIIKLAMIKVYNALKSEGLKAKLILQVHDELIIETPEEEKEQVSMLLVKNMEEACSLAVGLKAELNIGKNWYELK